MVLRRETGTGKECAGQGWKMGICSLLYHRLGNQLASQPATQQLKVRPKFNKHIPKMAKPVSGDPGDTKNPGNRGQKHQVTGWGASVGHTVVPLTSNEYVSTENQWEDGCLMTAVGRAFA